MHWPALIAIGFGAVIGAWLRWGLGLWLNAYLPAFPLGTLAANLGGAYLIGLTIGVCQLHPEISPTVRLLIITGFLGALTTFSTFSAEVVERLLANQLGWAFLIASIHLFGSLLLTWLGLLSAGSLGSGT